MDSRTECSRPRPLEAKARQPRGHGQGHRILSLSSRPVIEDTIPSLQLPPNSAVNSLMCRVLWITLFNIATTSAVSWRSSRRSHQRCARCFYTSARCWWLVSMPVSHVVSVYCRFIQWHDGDEEEEGLRHSCYERILCFYQSIKTCFYVFIVCILCFFGGKKQKHL